MKKNEKCKLVQDLLPNYIEKLTSEDTNKYIEEHLKECNECKEVLKNMGENIVLDKIEEKKKIDYLKKIKRRQKGTKIRRLQKKRPAPGIKKLPAPGIRKAVSQTS